MTVRGWAELVIFYLAVGWRLLLVAVIVGLFLRACPATAGTDDALRAVRALERIAESSEKAARAAERQAQCTR